MKSKDKLAKECFENAKEGLLLNAHIMMSYNDIDLEDVKDYLEDKLGYPNYDETFKTLMLNVVKKKEKK